MHKTALPRLAGIGSLVLAILCVGCGAGDFNWGKAKGIIEGSPVRLDAEYVMLDQNALDCGVQEGLWDAWTPLKGVPGEHTTARITDKARSLKFSDDVIIGEMRQPYVQIRGDFNLIALDIKSDRDGPEQGSKIVEVKTGVKIDHTCFPNPLVLMGVRKGNFTQDSNPLLVFRLDNGWQFERVMH
jgi:hypothetical protein